MRITAPAEADLDDIAAWIANENPDRAARFVEELWERCRSLGIRPRRFPVAQAIGGQAVRKLGHRGYLIFYLILEDRVEVARIVHGSRDWARLLRDE